MQKIKCKWLILINYSTATASKTKFIQSKTTKFDSPKYYKDSEMTAYISERSRNSKWLKNYDPP